jgi:hypothetical protein
MKFIKALHNQHGVAILMVISTIAILTFLLADFTFETKLNKIKVYNFQDREQARLNAEAGISLAMAKMRLYREALNMLEKNASLKDVLRPSQLESVVTQPFMFPLPLPPNASMIQKEALNKFIDENLLQGQVSLSITAISGFLNPNHLAAPTLDPDEQDSQQQIGSDQENEKQPPHLIIETKFIEMLENQLQEERETNENFDLLYASADPELLTKELKFVVNKADSLDDPLVGNVAGLYADLGITPRHAPFTSIDELYALAGWNDALVDLIKDRLTVHEVSVIPLNEMTLQQLTILFPDITPEQAEEFFKYRDGDPELGDEPHPFKSVEEFKDLVTSRLAIVSESDYEERLKTFADVGIKLGVAGKLFKIVSKGIFNRAEYELTAWVDLPNAPEPEKPKPTPTPDPEDGGLIEPPPPNPTPTPTPAPVQLLEPRILEIRPT